MQRAALVLMMLGSLMFTAACKKKVPPVPPGPNTTSNPDPGPVKVVEPPVLISTPRITSFTAEPLRVQRGQSITLRWATMDADNVTIDQGVGAVPQNGSRQLFPTGTTTYVLLARNGPRSDTRSVTVEVNDPPPVTIGSPTPPTTSGIPTASDLQDIYFDYDMSEFREDARRALNTDADLLKRIFAADPRVNYVIEGHADERGSAEYNLGLADRRAIVTRDALVQLGVPANRLRTISFGEEAPVCQDANEACWQRNRRAHFSPAQ